MCLAGSNSLKEKLFGLQEGRSFTHCVPLISCLIDGVERRFCKLFDDDFMRLAAISEVDLEF